MPEGVAIDAAITWAGALGCLFYLWTLYRNGRRGVGAQRLLISVMAALLAVRGFHWIEDRDSLDRLTFAIATWLPLAITLFIEHVLRRHHPLWVKSFALASSALFFVTGLVGRMHAQRAWLAAFAACLTLTVLLNGALLVGRRRAELSAGENRLADLLILVAFVSAVLVLSDFRTVTGLGSARLGAIGSLLFVYAMVGSTVRSAGTAVWFGRYLMLLVLAAALSALTALATASASLRTWWWDAESVWPVAYAWMLLTGIVVSSRELSSEGPTNEFLKWLAQVPLASSGSLIATLGTSPDAGTHQLLGLEDLADYDMAVLDVLATSHWGVVSLSIARHTRQDDDGPSKESADQWIDLLERTQMTHGFIARRAPAAVFLLNLPATTASDGAEMRLRVMQHLGVELESADREPAITRAEETL
jgi:hypothetical protein